VGEHIFCYVSYEDLKSYQNIPVTTDDDLLQGLCEIASSMWDGSTQRSFAPWRETRYYDYESPPGDALLMSARARQALFSGDWASVLKVDEDLLEVKVLTTENGETTISSDDYYLKCGHTYNVQPYDRIELKTDGDTTVFSFSGTYQKANSVDAIWGYHTDWARAWQSSGDSIQDAEGIDDSATALTVTDADGVDIYGVTPRFKVQTLIKAGDEYMYVIGKDTDTNILTVLRGVNGTTAASHAKDTALYVYRPIREVEHMVKRLAAWLYGQKDSPFQARQANTQTGVITIPDAAPVDVQAKANYYMRRSL